MAVPVMSELHKMPVYETTHPPLGKDLIMMGIAMFGMTGFGWRFSGTLFGVLLVPLAWCFVRRLTRKPWVAAVSGVLLALDFMRFSQSRLATIDVYGTFFILLGAYFMLWYCQQVLTAGVDSALLPMALGGLAFGLGCAAKWTGIYAGAGLAVLYLGVLYARWRQKQPGFWAEFRTAAVGGVLFYVLLPLCIYIASYLPYWWRNPSFSLGDWWQCQVSMYSYHSTLQATHPFESRWYTWLLGLRPVWYYRNGYLPYGTKASIVGMAGPVIWLAGLAALVGLLWRQVSGRGSRQGAGVLILYGTQPDPLDAGVAVYVLVPLFSQFHVLPGGAGPGAGPHEAPRLGQAHCGRPVRGGGRSVCALLPGPLRPAHPRLVGGCPGSAAELWVLLIKRLPCQREQSPIRRLRDSRPSALRETERNHYL